MKRNPLMAMNFSKGHDACHSRSWFPFPWTTTAPALGQARRWSSLSKSSLSSPCAEWSDPERSHSGIRGGEKPQRTSQDGSSSFSVVWAAMQHSFSGMWTISYAYVCIAHLHLSQPLALVPTNPIMHGCSRKEPHVRNTAVWRWGSACLKVVVKDTVQYWWWKTGTNTTPGPGENLGVWQVRWQLSQRW